MTGVLAKVGDSVRLERGSRMTGWSEVGTVEHVGDCGYPKCKWGDECAVIRIRSERRPNVTATVNRGPGGYDIV